MTTEALAPEFRKRSLFATAMAGQTGPVTLILLAVVALWYVGAVWMNAPWAIDRFEKQEIEWSAEDLVRATMVQARPILPPPHQVLAEMNKTILQKNNLKPKTL